MLSSAMNFNNTNWHLYKTFLITYETRNMSAAANILHLSRSAISHNNKELGNQLGVTLFTAHSKGVIPTGEANNLYPIVKNAITALVDAENNLRAFTGESKAVIRIGIAAADVEFYILNYLKDFCSKYPRVQLDFYSTNAMEMLTSGKLDFVIHVGVKAKNTGFKIIDLFTVEGVFMASKQFLKNHGLTQNMSLTEFSRLPMISFHSWEEEYRDFARQNHLPEPNFIVRSNMVTTNHHMMKNSIGIEFYIKGLFGDLNSDVVEVTVEDYKISPVTFVCVYNNLSRPARTFIDALQVFGTMLK